MDDIPEADIYVSMGCNVVCPHIPGKLNYNWGLQDPTGMGDEAFLEVMKQIEQHVYELKEILKA